MLKANWGRFYFNPGIDARRRGERRTPPTSTRITCWNDINGDRVFQEGEAGTQVAALRRHRRRVDRSRTSTTPTATKRRSSSSARWSATSASAPASSTRRTATAGSRSTPRGRYSAFNIPVTVVDPGPDGVLRQRRRRPTCTAFNLSDTDDGRQTTRPATSTATRTTSRRSSSRSTSATRTAGR